MVKSGGGREEVGGEGGGGLSRAKSRVKRGGKAQNAPGRQKHAKSRAFPRAILGTWRVCGEEGGGRGGTGRDREGSQESWPLL